MRMKQPTGACCKFPCIRFYEEAPSDRSFFFFVLMGGTQIGKRLDCCSSDVGVRSPPAQLENDGV